MNTCFHLYAIQKPRFAPRGLLCTLSFIFGLFAAFASANGAVVNSVTNSGFEDNLNGWTWQNVGSAPVTGSIDTTQQHWEGQSAKLTYTGSTQPAKYGQLSQVVYGLTNGVTYYAYVWCKGTSVGTNATVAAGASLQTQQALPSGTYDWTCVEMVFTADGTTVPLAITVNDTTTSLWVDDIYVTDVRLKNVNDLGIYGDGTTNVTSGLSSALATYQFIYLPAGTYKTTSAINLPTGSAIWGDGATSIISVQGSSASSVFTASGTSMAFCGDNEISGVKMIGFNAQWNIDVTKAKNMLIRNCYSDVAGLFHSTLAITYSAISSTADLNSNLAVVYCTITNPANTTNNSVGIVFAYAIDCVAKYNVVSYMRHGIQYWGGDSKEDRNGDPANPRWARNITFTGNTVHNMLAGGIWGSMGKDILIDYNNVSTCGDVGIDFEGSFDGVAEYNTVSDGKNGTLATFYVTQNIVFRYNTVTNSDSASYPLLYKNYHDGGSASNASEHSVTFQENEFVMTAGRGLIRADAASHTIFEDNDFSDVQINLNNMNASLAPTVVGNNLVFSRDDSYTGTTFYAIDIGYRSGTLTVSDNILMYSGATRSNKTGINIKRGSGGGSATANIEGNLVSGFARSDIVYLYTGTDTTLNVNYNEVGNELIMVSAEGQLTINATGNTDLGSTPVSPTWFTAVPTRMSAASANGQVTVAWTAPYGATSYNVKRATVSGGPYSTIATGVTTASYVDTGLTNGGQYFYVVSAVGISGESENSVQTGAIPEQSGNYVILDNASPSGVTITGSWGTATTTAGYWGSNFATNGNTGAGSKSMRFTPSLVGASYDVYIHWTMNSRDRATNVPIDIIHAGGTTTVTVDQQLDGGIWVLLGTFDFNTGTAGSVLLRTTGTNNFVVGDAVAFVKKPATTTPLAPTGLGAIADDQEVHLSWAAPYYAASYNIKRSTSSGGPYSTVATGITATAYTDTGRTNGTTYYYVVSAVNSFGEGSNSGEASATAVADILSSAPTGVSAAGSTGQIAVSWTASVGARTYNVKRSLSSGGSLTTVGSAITTTGFTDSAVTNGTSYYYVVTAVNNAGESGNSTETSATALAAPTGLSANAGGMQVDLSWSGVTGATAYKVKRALSSGGPFTTVASNISGTSWTNSELTDGTTYYFVVAATATSSESANSTQANATPVDPATAPQAPTGFLAIGGDAQNWLTWNPTNYAVSYTVKRSATSGSGYSTVASGLTGTRYVDSSLTIGTTYYYVVCAVNSHGTGPDSTEASAAPQSPTILKDNTDASGITIIGAWTASGGVSGYYGSNCIQDGNTGGTGGKSVKYTPTITASGDYDVYLRWASFSNRASNAPVDINHSSGTSTVSVNQKVDGGLWFYVGCFPFATGTAGNVTIRNDGANGFVVADAVEFIRVGAIPPVAGGLSATGGNAQVSLSWSAATGATTYNVKRGTTSGSYSNLATGVSGTSYTDTTAVNETTYYYVVSGVNGNGEGANSSEASATPHGAPDVPTGAAALGGDGQVWLSWGAATGAAGYNVKRSASSGGSYTTVATNVADLWFLDSGRTNGTTYYYVISAVNSGGESANSSEVSAAAKAATIVKDSSDASGITITGAWTNSAGTAGYYGANYKFDNNTGGTGGKSVQYSPTISTAGNYDVYVRWAAASNRASNTPIDINYSGGSTTVSVNQKVNGGVWFYVGTYSFATGTSGNVTIRNDGANGNVIADAVEFILH